MFKFLLLGGIIYFVYRYMWRDNSLAQRQKQVPFTPKSKPEVVEQIEDVEYTEENK